MAALLAYTKPVWAVETGTHSSTEVSDEMYDFLQSLKIGDIKHYTRLDQYGRRQTYTIKRSDRSRASQKNTETGMIRNLTRYNTTASSPRLPALAPMKSAVEVYELTWKFESDTPSVFRSVSAEMNALLYRLHIGRGWRFKGYWLHKTGLKSGIQTNLETGKVRDLMSSSDSSSRRRSSSSSGSRSSSIGSIGVSEAPSSVTFATTKYQWEYKDDRGKFQPMSTAMSDFITGMQVATEMRYRTDSGDSYTFTKYSSTHGSQTNNESGTVRDLRGVKVAVSSLSDPLVSSFSALSLSSHSSSSGSSRTKKAMVWQVENDSQMYVPVYPEMNKKLNSLKVGSSDVYAMMVGSEALSYKFTRIAHNSAIQENVATKKSRILRAVYIDAVSGKFIGVVL